MAYQNVTGFNMGHRTAHVKKMITAVAAIILEISYSYAVNQHLPDSVVPSAD